MHTTTDTQKKSPACQFALSLMDQDMPYKAALVKALLRHPEIERKDLEEELDIYI